MMRWRSAGTVATLACLLLIGATAAGYCQIPGLNLPKVPGLPLPGGGGGGGLGAAAALGGELLKDDKPARAPAAAPTIIMPQPVMLIHGNSLYIAYEGKVTRFDLMTLAMLAEGYYAPLPDASPEAAAKAK